MKFSSVFKCNKPLGEKEYILEVLNGLYADPKCPTNLFDGLKIVRTEFYTEEVAFVKGHIEADYTASIGYDHQETYTEWVEKYDYDLKCTVRKPVTKTKTVTEWQPFYTHESYDETVCETNGTWKYMDLSSIMVATIQANADDFDRVDEEVPVRYGLESDAEQHLQRRIRYHYVYWPGDHHKDEDGHGTVDLIDAYCCIVPCMKVIFSFEGKEYTSCGIALHQADEVHEMPEATNGEKTEQDFDNEFHEKDAKSDKMCDIMKWIGIIGMVAGGVAGLVGLTTGMSAVAIAGLVAFGLCLVLLITSAIVRKVMWNVNYDACYKAKQGVKTQKQDS